MINIFILIVITFVMVINVKNLVTNNGVVEIQVPRDRSSRFEPALIPKRQRRIEGFDVISLHAKGMSLPDIRIQLQEFVWS